jgi:hypothetical protein
VPRWAAKVNDYGPCWPDDVLLGASSGDLMVKNKVEEAVEEDVSEIVVALQALKSMYSDMLNEYERQIDELAELSKAPRQTLYNPAVLCDIECVAHRKKREDVLGSVWVAQSELNDIIAVQRTISLIKMDMSDKAIASVKKEERDIDHENLPYEAM